MAKILVTGGDERAALAIVRSLGRAGHRVIVGSRAGRSLAGASRYAARDLALGDPLAAPGAFSARVRDEVGSEAVDVILPVTEPDLLAILPMKEQLSPVVVPFPDLAVFLAASDKARVADLAKGVGLSVPRQMVVRRDDIRSLPARAEEAVVLKPGRSVRSGAKLSVAYVAKGEALRRAVARMPAAAFPLLVQHRVVGPGVGVFMLRWEGRVLAAMAHRRLREKPPSGGVSVFRESVVLDPGIHRMAEELLEALEWSGVAMIELKIDEVSGAPYIMEINGRFWGSLQLAIDAGVDFPALLVDAALGRPVRRIDSCRVGVRSRWIMGDLDHVLMRLRRSSGELNLPPGAPGRARTVAGFVRAFAPPVRSEVFRWSDPGPFWAETRCWLGSLVGGRAR